jgi:hypothetical protein
MALLAPSCRILCFTVAFRLTAGIERAVVAVTAKFFATIKAIAHRYLFLFHFPTYLFVCHGTHPSSSPRFLSRRCIPFITMPRSSPRIAH